MHYVSGLDLLRWENSEPNQQQVEHKRTTREMFSERRKANNIEEDKLRFRPFVQLLEVNDVKVEVVYCPKAFNVNIKFEM